MLPTHSTSHSDQLYITCSTATRAHHPEPHGVRTSLQRQFRLINTDRNRCCCLTDAPKPSPGRLKPSPHFLSCNLGTTLWATKTWYSRLYGRTFRACILNWRQGNAHVKQKWNRGHSPADQVTVKQMGDFLCVCACRPSTKTGPCLLKKKKEK